MIRALAARHWRTALGAAAGAVGGALYAHFIGCRTGTCLITSSVWHAGVFFGLTGGLIARPGPTRAAPPERERPPRPAP